MIFSLFLFYFSSKAVNREEMKFMTLLYVSNPRLTFLYLYVFKYTNVFLPLVKSQVVLSSNMEKIEEKALENELFDSEGKWIERIPSDEAYEGDEILEVEENKKQVE